MLDPNNPFADLVPSASAGVILGPPKEAAPKTTFHTLSPDEVKAKNLNPDEIYQVDSEGKVSSIGKLPNQNDTQAKTQSAMDSTRDLIQSIERARGLVSNWSTGLGGAVGKLYPGSDQANQLDTVVHQELRGNIFKNWVAQLKAQSDTGTSGIGRIMQSEIPLVTGSLGALDPVKMGRQGTLESFDQIENRVLRSAALLNNENPDDPKVLQKYKAQFLPHTAMPGATPPAAGMGGSSDGGPSSGGSGGGGPAPPGVTNLSDDQKKAYGAFLAANPKPTGDQVGAFLTTLTGQPVTNGDAIAKAINQGRGASTTVENKTLQDRIDQKVNGYVRQGDNAGAAAITGVADTVSLGTSDEFGGALNAFGDALKGKGSFGDLYNVDVGANREYQRRLRDEHAPSYIGGQVAGGFLLPTGEVSGVAGAAKLGAAYGGAYGAGSAEGGLSQRVGGALAGSIVGAGAGAAGAALAPYVARVLPKSFRAPQGMAPALADASQAENVDLIRPMVDPASRAKFGALESDPTAQPIVRGGAENVRSQIEGRVLNGPMSNGGQVLEPGPVGQRLQDASNRYITRTKGIKDRLYQRAERLAGNTPIATSEATAQIDRELADLSASPTTNASQIKLLEGLKSDLHGAHTVRSIRDIRTSLRDEIGRQNLTFTQAEARALRVMDAAKQDIQRDAPQAAASAYSRADAFNAERHVMMNDIKASILGKPNAPLDPQTAFANIKSLTAPGANGRRLGAIMRHLEPDERQDVAATIAQALGRDSADGPFSAAKFVSQTGSNKFSPSSLRTIFGPDGAESIKNLRTLSQALKDAGGDINRSRSTTVANRMSPIRTAAKSFVASITGLGPAMGGYAAGGVEGGAIGLAGGAAALGASKGLKVLSARSMVNPRVSRWLAESAQASTPAQAKEATRKLGVIIAREPAIAHELKPIYDMLERRLELPLAAAPEQSGGSNNDGS